MALTSETRGEANFIHLPERVDAAIAADMNQKAAYFSGLAVKVHIFDFSRTKSVAEGFFGCVRPFADQAALKKQMVASVGMCSEVQASAQAQGVLGHLNPVASVNDALKAVGVQPKMSIDLEFVTPFVKAAQNTLKVQANLELQFGKPYFKKADQTFNIGITGVIGLSSQQFRGSISICFPKEVFLGVYESMIGEKHTEITKDIEDAAGELLNIIFGQAKAVLNDKQGYTIGKAIPTVLSGEKISVHHRSSVPAIIVPFQSSVGNFHMEILADPT